jgi:hypothetical protein
VREVDGLLRRIAAELDAGRPVGSLIENATVRTRNYTMAGTFDIDAVDWFVDQLLRPSHDELAGMSEDPWRDLGVTAVFSRGASRKYFHKDCGDGWRNFGKVPGVHLRWEDGELRSAEQQTLASVAGGMVSLGSSGRRFTIRKSGSAGSWSPDIAELGARSFRDFAGHLSNGKLHLNHRLDRGAGKTWSGRPGELVDEMGIPILHSSGANYAWRACARVTFPDERWLRFLVRGTGRTNAIMTAVDQDGNKVARYRLTGKLRSFSARTARTAEITVHPGHPLTDELVLAIAISAPWLSSYFSTPGGGGG